MKNLSGYDTIFLVFHPTNLFSFLSRSYFSFEFILLRLNEQAEEHVMAFEYLPLLVSLTSNICPQTTHFLYRGVRVFSLYVFTDFDIFSLVSFVCRLCALLYLAAQEELQNFLCESISFPQNLQNTNQICCRGDRTRTCEIPWSQTKCDTNFATPRNIRAVYENRTHISGLASQRTNRCANTAFEASGIIV